MRARVAPLTSSIVALTWLVMAVLVAAGGAGIVASLHYVPGTPARAELTWAGDEAARPALDDATAGLQALSDAVDALGSTARDALAAVAAGDADEVNRTIALGTAQLATIDERAGALRAAIDAVPGTGRDTELRIAPELRRRHDALVDAPSLVDGVRTDWAAFTGRALDATNLFDLLARHDQETAAAAKQGSVGKYQTALDLLAVSRATLDEIEAVRDRLGRTADVATLTIWLDRNRAYDGALGALYQALIDANGKATDAVKTAYATERAALRRLPVDTKPLVVIMAEVAQGGMNQAVIRIEETRGSLAAALDTQEQLQQGIQPPE